MTIIIATLVIAACTLVRLLLLAMLSLSCLAVFYVAFPDHIVSLLLITRFGHEQSHSDPSFGQG